MKQRAALAAVLAVGILAGYGIVADLPEPLDGQIHGTYSCDANKLVQNKIVSSLINGKIEWEAATEEIDATAT